LSVESLPGINACLNALSACLLVAGWLFIKSGKVFAHRVCMGSAFLSSVVFLASYLAHHYLAGIIYYHGAHRGAYLALLGTHTLLAVLVPPLAIRTLYLALKDRFEEHKRAARWTLPIWLYVSVTGVIVYEMLYRS
jgi:putative membrane protein